MDNIKKLIKQIEARIERKEESEDLDKDCNLLHQLLTEKAMYIREDSIFVDHLGIIKIEDLYEVCFSDNMPRLISIETLIDFVAGIDTYISINSSRKIHEIALELFERLIAERKNYYYFTGW